MSPPNATVQKKDLNFATSKIELKFNKDRKYRPFNQESKSAPPEKEMKFILENNKTTWFIYFIIL